MALTIESTVALRNGIQMPRLQFGVYQSKSPVQSTTKALEAGYVAIDTARYYYNQAEVGEAVRDFKHKTGSSKGIWLTSKVFGSDHGTKRTDLAVEESITELVPSGQKWSLYLLHDATSGAQARLEAWRVLEDKVAEGKIGCAGVSNFSDKHLQQFKDAGVRSMPLVNQIELHPWCQQKPIVEYCQKEGIVVQAYCPLVRGQRMSDPTLQAVAKEVGKTPGQVLIRWSLQRGFVPLPKSDTASRIVENASVFDFELSKEHMAKLDALDKGDAGACSWNPVNVA